MLCSVDSIAISVCGATNKCMNESVTRCARQGSCSVVAVASLLCVFVWAMLSLHMRFCLCAWPRGEIEPCAVIHLAIKCPTTHRAACPWDFSGKIRPPSKTAVHC
ncbi:unnamed protein product [Ostreobium quekettii]|uniref:Uncharacterized protein n=1 Tax=Ostreobium quekettii TaxID=121088 RepID=A0A8S1IUK3_9CHLO|nr:unnamed protein product [Ostreobium quekettii]